VIHFLGIYKELAMKIFEALRQDHEKQRLLLKILAETSGNTAARREYYGYTDLMVDGAPSPHQSDTTLRWLIDRLRS
jgi:hypothetical protein